MTRWIGLLLRAVALFCLAASACQVREASVRAGGRSASVPAEVAGKAAAATEAQAFRGPPSRPIQAAAGGERMAKPARGAVVDKPKLDVRYEDGTIYVRLTNRSPRPIRVDGDLVVGVELSFLDENGEYLEDVVVKDPPGVETPSCDLRQRIKKVEPGETVERAIRLKEPFRRLEVAVGHGLEIKTNICREFVFAGEGWWIVREPERARRVKARYVIGSLTQAGIQQLFGAFPAELDLYMGELKAQCSIPATSKAAGGGPTRKARGPDDAGWKPP